MNVLSRPTHLGTVTRRISATRSVKTIVTTYADTTTFDAMRYVRQLNDRQHDAACRLYGHFLASGLLPGSTADYRAVSEECDAGEIGEDEGEEIGEEALATYRRILREAGPWDGPMLDALMHGQHPRNRLAGLQDALDALADRWGMER